jgi:transcription initiation factor IIE alpha subunit
MMAPHFGNDPRKMATLYCCAECKPKVMFGDALEKGFAK